MFGLLPATFVLPTAATLTPTTTTSALARWARAGPMGRGAVAAAAELPATLPARKVLNHLQWIANCKSLLLFVATYTLFASINSRRMDVSFGHQTLKWLSEAHVDVGLKPLDKLDDVEPISIMMQDGLPRVVTSLQNICHECNVGLTTHYEDLRFLGLESFLCSDFDSQQNSEVYPTRDCAVQDARWAAAPSSDTAPCCKNATLVKASIKIMAQHESDGRTTSTLQRLQVGNEAATLEFVKRHVNSDQFLMQLIVSRRQRMAATQYRASWVDHEGAPTKLDTMATYWSANYSIPWELASLRLALLVALVMTFMHDRRMQRADAVRESMQSQRAKHAAVQDDNGELRLRGKGYVLCIELPSTFGPLALEVMRYVLDLPAWHMLVALVEMLLSVRLFHDAAAVVPPMRRLVLVFSEALPNILAYIVSLAPLAVLTAVMHNQLFGLFDDGFADVSTAITRVVRYLTAPPPATRVEPEAFQAIGLSDGLLYYWSTFTFRLAFGAFIVAILVGAFNRVIELEKVHNERVARDMSLPPRYVDRSLGGASGALMHTYWFGMSIFTREVYGASLLELIRVLGKEVYAREVMSSMTSVDTKPTDAQMYALFSAFDESGDGSISVEELQAALSKAGKQVSLERCIEILHQVDTNFDGEISYDEFVQVRAPAPPTHSPRAVRESLSLSISVSLSDDLV